MNGQGKSAPDSEDPKHNRFTWVLKEFSKSENLSIRYSEVFTIGGLKWHIAALPKDINTKHLGLFLVAADHVNLSDGLSCLVAFSIGVINQIDHKYTLRKGATHWFNRRNPDWGFLKFKTLEELYDPSQGYLVDDRLLIEVVVNTATTLQQAYDSKKERGFVGLQNQGATCYMNSLIQALFHIPYFRKAVYRILPTKNEQTSNSIPLALQHLFYEMQYSDTAISTKGLTQSFGWNSHETVIHQDVQELNRLLCDKFESQMRGTKDKSTIKELFEGHHMNYIECINVNFKSKRKESFLDLQLDVKGCKDVYASFDKYVEPEILEGDNKYHSEFCGFQDAWKGVLFIDFPPVLQLQLKRFGYDFEKEAMVKFNDRYEFPLELDLDRENRRYLSSDADASVRNVYALHSVLVHSGSIHQGHYYAYIRPTLTDPWYKFNDDVVSKEETKNFFEDLYGRGETYPGLPNAYMLVYIRQADIERIMCNADENDIAENLRASLKEELEGKQRNIMQMEKANMWIIIQVVTEYTLAAQYQSDNTSNSYGVRLFHINKGISFDRFKEQIANEFRIPVPVMRFWPCYKEALQPFCLGRPLTRSEENTSVGYLQEIYGYLSNFILYLDVNQNKGAFIYPLPHISEDDILVLIKLYNPHEEIMQYLGRIFVKALDRPCEILQRLNEMADFPVEQNLDLYQEMGSRPGLCCRPIDKNVTFRTLKIHHGDIICFQKILSLEEMKSLHFPDVRSYLDYIHRKQTISLRSLKSSQDEFSIEFYMNDSYDEVVQRIECKLGIMDGASKIRLISHDYDLEKPSSLAIDFRKLGSFRNMLPFLWSKNSPESRAILYYEVLDSAPEDCAKTLEVAIHNQKTMKVSAQSVLLPDFLKFSDLIAVLKDKCRAHFSSCNAEIRILEIVHNRIGKIFDPTEIIGDMSNCELRAEEIPEEEKEMSDHDTLICVYHFRRPKSENEENDSVTTFGDPFFLVINEKETVIEVKSRIKRKLEVPDDEFAKWKFAVLYNDIPPECYLEDHYIISQDFKGSEAWNQCYLGIDHGELNTAQTSVKEA